MPIIKLTLIKGYPAKLRQNLSKKITDLVIQLTGAVAQGTTVVIEEVDHVNYMRGRENKVPSPITCSAIEFVKKYLAAVEKRDIEKASKFLADNFWMEFPGSVRMTQLEELLAWSKLRYKKIKKSYVDFYEAYQECETLVTCHGVLEGIWLDGQKFQDIRFIDVFTISGCKITSQMVWNDLDTVSRAG